MFDLFQEIAVRSTWSTQDIINLLDFTYSLFRAHIIDADLMNQIVSLLWSLV